MKTNNVYKIFTKVDEVVVVQRIIMRLNQLIGFTSKAEVEAAIIAIHVVGFSKSKLLDRHINNLLATYAVSTIKDALNILQIAKPVLDFKSKKVS